MPGSDCRRCGRLWRCSQDDAERLLGTRIIGPLPLGRHVVVIGFSHGDDLLEAGGLVNGHPDAGRRRDRIKRSGMPRDEMFMMRSSRVLVKATEYRYPQYEYEIHKAFAGCFIWSFSGWACGGFVGCRPAWPAVAGAGCGDRRPAPTHELDRRRRSSEHDGSAWHSGAPSRP